MIGMFPQARGQPARRARRMTPTIISAQRLICKKQPDNWQKNVSVRRCFRGRIYQKSTPKRAFLTADFVEKDGFAFLMDGSERLNS